MDYYANTQEAHILALIQQQYAKNAEKVLPVTVNVVRKIVDLKSAVYMQDCTRIVSGTEQDAAIYASFEDSASLPATMKQANRLSTLLGTVFLRPVFRRGRVELDILTPDKVDVVCGDSPADIQALAVENWTMDGKAESRTYSVWTGETFVRLNYRGGIVEEQPNPYGAIPYIPVHSSLPIDDFWNAGASADLMSAQDAVNLHLSGLFYTLFYQGHATGWLKGAGDAGASDLAFGPGSMLTLPSDGEVGFVSPDAPIDAMLAALNFLLEQVAVQNGLPASAVTSKAREMSGAALLVENSELAEARRDQIAMFAKVEQELFNLFKAIWNVHNPTRPMSEAATLRTDFFEPTVSQSPYDRFRLFKDEYNMGITSAVDYLISKNPDLSRQDAIEELVRIHEENSRLAKISPASMNMGGFQIPAFPTQ